MIINTFDGVSIVGTIFIPSIFTIIEGQPNLTITTLEETIAHEYAHCYRWRHCKRHNRLTEKIYQRILEYMEKYREMSPEEQAVVDSFQGKADYAKVTNDPDRYRSQKAKFFASKHPEKAIPINPKGWWEFFCLKKELSSFYKCH